jgi:hypothetical protein
MSNKSRGLFDEQFRLDKIGKQYDRLIKLLAHVCFNQQTTLHRPK